MTRSQELIDISAQYLAPNYAPLPVVLNRGEGCWLWDVDDKRYLDFHSGYSAINFGHRYPPLIERAKAQLDRLTMTSRAFHAEELSLLSKEICELCATEMALFMNSGAEAVETAIKASRRWSYEQRGIPENQGEIVVFNKNFHGRTTTIISFSDEPASRSGFGPFTPGFVMCPFGDIAALEEVITDRTIAVLLEPIQGEAGVIVPPPGYLAQLGALCRQKGILLLSDEIQSGLYRAGDLFAVESEGVKADLYIIGKSLGGGIVPISAVLGRREILSVLRPGTHGSTFGGNPFACAIAREVVQILKNAPFLREIAQKGTRIRARLEEAQRSTTSRIKEVRGRGLFFGLELDRSVGKAKDLCLKLAADGLLCKDTRTYSIRLAPPLIISDQELDHGLDILFGRLTGG